MISDKYDLQIEYEKELYELPGMPDYLEKYDGLKIKELLCFLLRKINKLENKIDEIIRDPMTFD